MQDDTTEENSSKLTDTSHHVAHPSDTATPTPATPPAPTPGNLNRERRDSPGLVSAHHGLKFVAGKLEFSFTALPTELLYTLRMFAAAKRGDLDELKNIVELSKASDLTVPYVSVSQTDNTATSSAGNRYSTISVASNQGADVNAEYQRPSYSDDAFLSGPSFSRRRSSVHAVRNVTLLSPLSLAVGGGGGAGSAGSGSVPGGVVSAEEHKLLLHIAIEKNHLDMVVYLISQNADVSWTVILYSSYVCIKGL